MGLPRFPVVENNASGLNKHNGFCRVHATFSKHTWSSVALRSCCGCPASYGANRKGTELEGGGRGGGEKPVPTAAGRQNAKLSRQRELKRFPCLIDAVLWSELNHPRGPDLRRHTRPRREVARVHRLLRFLPGGLGWAPRGSHPDIRTETKHAHNFRETQTSVS